MSVSKINDDDGLVNETLKYYIIHSRTSYEYKKYNDKVV